MFEPRKTQSDASELIELLVVKGMGWAMHEDSGHREGSRDIPHAWRWRTDRTHIMVYLGGDGPEANAEFNPIDDEACARELLARISSTVSGEWDLSKPEGRSAFCVAAREALSAVPDDVKPLPEEIGAPPILTDGTIPPWAMGKVNDG